MSLDPLNVGLLKICGENLVVAFSRVFFLSKMNVTSFSVCKLALASDELRRFNKLAENIFLVYFTFLRENDLFFPRKNTKDIRLRIPLGLFLLRGRSSKRRYVYAN